jgi:hypothetical protein
MTLVTTARKGAMASYRLDFAGDQGDCAAKENDRSASDQGNGGADIESTGPQGQEEVLAEVCLVVDSQRVGGCTDDGRPSQEGESSQTEPGRLDQASCPGGLLISNIAHLELMDIMVETRLERHGADEEEALGRVKADD